MGSCEGYTSSFFLVAMTQNRGKTLKNYAAVISIAKELH
jgi:hypothetical protein